MTSAVVLPEWAETMVRTYKGGTISSFVLHGNVHDLVPVEKEDEVEFVTLRSFLSRVMFPSRDVVLFYDVSSGITAADASQMSRFLDVVRAVDKAGGYEFSRSLPRDPRKAVFLLDRFLRASVMGKHKRRVALVVEYAQQVVPAQDLQFMNYDESSILVTFLRWAKDPLFRYADVTVCLVCENLSDLHPSLVRNPYVKPVKIPLPDEEQRRMFVEESLGGATGPGRQDEDPGAPSPAPGLDAGVLARLTSGLSRINIEHLVRQAVENGGELSLEYVTEAKKTLIEQECYGLLEFIPPSYSLELVSGHEEAKKWLQEDARLLAEGHTEAVPMGYLVCGPVGTGKTFLAMCYAGTVGLPCVKLKNFRSQWQGVTEGNWEKILTVLKAAGPVVVVIDEADAALGDRNARGDSGTSGRVFSMLASTMGDTSNRGRIVWFLLTCRPDLLPVDLKRQGRAEVHIPLFYPSTPAERRDMFAAMGRKLGIGMDWNTLDDSLLQRRLSGAEIEALLTRARRRALLDGRERPVPADVRAELEAYVPSLPEPAVKYQELVAVRECTDVRFLPPSYRELDPAELERLIRRYSPSVGA